LAQQAAIAIDNVALVRNLAAQERLRQELEIARRTQRDLMPAAPPRLPGLDIAGASSPASIVGGDFLGYYVSIASDSQVAIAVGDVSGHGMPAALLMTLTVGLLGAESRGGAKPADLLAHLGASLGPHCERSRLNVAVCYAWVRGDGTMCVANAGGIAPLVRRVDGRVEWLDVHGLPLGIELMTEPPVEQSAHLAPGEALVMITDGLVEARNEAGQMFGFDRLELASAPLDALSSAGAAQDYILKALHTYTAPVEPEDDVTMVVVVKQ
jgi:sigma-B regulation protein RsbU (phosphoserine phosphatase)